EELGIYIDGARPLIRVPHAYPDRRVLLDVWRVTGWRGEPRGREGQELDWVEPDAIARRSMPAADVPVVNAIRLPDRYVVTPAPGADRDNFLECFETLLSTGVVLVQFRAHGLDDRAYAALARECADRCRAHGATLLLNRDPALVSSTGAHGVHLTSERLGALDSRPLDRDHWVGVSCHDATELDRARRIGADFAVLSPVRGTPGHRERPLLGWDGFAGLVGAAALPVYALGGVGPADLESAWRHGAQGVAGIRAFWPSATDGKK
ncbi:MAG: Nudix family hydrolase, partial [Gammaproteobacteria bacterium]|nr:Nudix family hydrolase [Gammaproteobacteria bacterium]